VKILPPTNYTFYQAGAFACLLASALWAVTSLGAAINQDNLTISAVNIFTILTVIGWILLPLYALKVKWGYIIGIIVWILALVGLLAMPGTTPWYTFSFPVYNLSFVLFYLIGLDGIYCSYRSYKEV
jgi:hypothetical protein